jgi:hypothetical protein
MRHNNDQKDHIEVYQIKIIPVQYKQDIKNKHRKQLNTKKSDLPVKSRVGKQVKRIGNFANSIEFIKQACQPAIVFLPGVIQIIIPDKRPTCTNDQLINDQYKSNTGMLVFKSQRYYKAGID